MHKLLQRQLRRHLKDAPPAESLSDFLNAVDDAYQQSDQDRALIERSLELTSLELNERNALLRAQINELEDTHIKLEQSISTLSAIFDSTGEAILSFDAHGKLIKCNDMASSLLSIPICEGTDTLHRFLVKIYRLVDNPSTIIHDLQHLKSTPKKHCFGILHLKNNQIYEYHSSPQLQGNNLLGRVWCFRNISDVKKNEALLIHQAHHDQLTNLPNRTLLEDRLKHALNLADGTSKSTAILYIDLDNFKKVNDTSGHQAGDQLLIEVASRIQNCLREQDTLARVGGDEFIILLENIQNNTLATIVSNRIIQALKEPFLLENEQYFISCSIGISLSPRDGTTSELLLKKADMAMYHAKSQGRSNFQHFDPALEQFALQYLSIENKLREALEQNHLEIHFQPQVNLSNLEFSSVEALIRWKDDNGKYISPITFIPVAEQAGLINEISNWVFHQSCQQIVYWRSLGLSPVTISINLSPRELLDTHLPQRLQHILQEYGISGEHFELEITETMFLEDIKFVKKVLSRIRALNISIAIDDFGTGYSSLRYLQQLPIDTLKIDKSFVLHLMDNPQDAAIANSIISLGKNLGIKVVAEGVENLSTSLYLKEQGCDLAQGFFYHRPTCAEKITSLLLHQHSANNTHIQGMLAE